MSPGYEPGVEPFHPSAPIGRAPADYNRPDPGPLT